MQNERKKNLLFVVFFVIVFDSVICNFPFSSTTLCSSLGCLIFSPYSRSECATILTLLFVQCDSLPFYSFC